MMTSSLIVFALTVSSKNREIDPLSTLNSNETNTGEVVSSVKLSACLAS